MNLAGTKDRADQTELGSIAVNMFDSRMSPQASIVTTTLDQWHKPRRARDLPQQA